MLRPWGTDMLLAVLAGCAPPAPSSAPAARPAVHLSGIAAPQGDAQRQLQSTALAIIDGVEHPISFQPIIAQGQVVGEWAFGHLTDITGAPIVGTDGEPVICPITDFNGMIEVDGALFLLSHFECSPGAIYQTALAQDADGMLTPLWTRPVDLSAVGGGAVHCAGDITPWNTLLSSEEYEPDARQLQPDGSLKPDPFGYNEMVSYWGDRAGSSPYRYGWIPEVAVVDAAGAVDVHKRYALGRFSHELGLVMPDARTVYLTDDGSNTGFFLFIADEAGDLSAGTLYAARWSQLVDTGGGLAALGWVNLGHAEEGDIAALLEQGVDFAELLDAAEPEAGRCPDSYASIHTATGRECLRLVPGMEVAASRLESRRYAAIRGATTELSKSEGLAFDADSARLYLAMSAVTRGMAPADPRWDEGGPDHVRLATARCGAIYELPIAGAALDTEGQPMGSSFVVRSAQAVIVGEATEEGCAADSISNPDNITWLPGGGLLIAEDTSHHVNNALWLADPSDGSLTRILTAPLGGEVSGIHWFDDIGGRSYLGVTIQHPFRGVADAPEGADRSLSGYLGPFP